MQTLFLLYVGGGVLLGILAIPLLLRKVKPNPFYGFRVPATLNNPELWYSTNQYFAKRQLAIALVEIGSATGLYFVPGINVDAYALSVLGVFVVVFAIALLQSLKFMKSVQSADYFKRMIEP